MRTPPCATDESGCEETGMRVLVAFEDVRSMYREVIARAIRDLRPDLEVYSGALSELEHELASIDPHVVVCSRPTGEYLGSRGAWVEIPTEDGAKDDERLAQICLDGERWITEGPPLREILEVIDETRERLREGRLSEAC